MNKKGQLQVSTAILIILALLVLVILAFAVTGNFQNLMIKLGIVEEKEDDVWDLYGNYSEEREKYYNDYCKDNFKEISSYVEVMGFGNVRISGANNCEYIYDVSIRELNIEEEGNKINCCYFEGNWVNYNGWELNVTEICKGFEVEFPSYEEYRKYKKRI